jgi:transposase-like protein
VTDIPGLLPLRVTHPTPCPHCGQDRVEFDVLRACTQTGRIWDDARYSGCGPCNKTWRVSTPTAHAHPETSP